jgi:colicin import membrane protein
MAALEEDAVVANDAERLGLVPMDRILRLLIKAANADPHHDFLSSLIAAVAKKLRSSKNNAILPIRREELDKRLDKLINSPLAKTSLYNHIEPLLKYILPDIPAGQADAAAAAVSEDDLLGSINLDMDVLKSSLRGLTNALTATQSDAGVKISDIPVYSELNKKFTLDQTAGQEDVTREYNISGQVAKVKYRRVAVGGDDDDEEEGGIYADLPSLLSGLANGVRNFVLIIDATNLSMTRLRQGAAAFATAASPVNFYILLSAENSADPATKVSKLKAAADDNPNVNVYFLKDTDYKTRFDPATAETTPANVMRYLFSSMGLRTYQNTDRNVTGEITFTDGETLTINNLGDLSEITTAGTLVLQQLLVRGNGDDAHIASLVKAASAATAKAADRANARNIIERIVVYIFLKRCGDWCQALCLMDRDRVYKAVQWDGITPASIDGQETVTIRDIIRIHGYQVEVSLFTHDRILLAYCIIMGDNVFFSTKYKEKNAGGAWSIIWALYFKNKRDVDPAAEAAYKVNRLEASTAKRTALGGLAAGAPGIVAAITAQVATNLSEVFLSNIDVYLAKVYLIMYALSKVTTDIPVLPADLPAVADLTLSVIDKQDYELDRVETIYKTNQEMLAVLQYAYSITGIGADGNFTFAAVSAQPPQFPSRMGEYARSALSKFKERIERGGITVKDAKLNHYENVKDLLYSDILQFRKSFGANPVPDGLLPPEKGAIRVKSKRRVISDYELMHTDITELLTAVQAGGAIGDLNVGGISPLLANLAPTRRYTFDPNWSNTRDALSVLWSGLDDSFIEWLESSVEPIYNELSMIIQEPTLTQSLCEVVSDSIAAWYVWDHAKEFTYDFFTETQTLSKASTDYIPYISPGTRFQDANGKYYTTLNTIVTEYIGNVLGRIITKNTDANLDAFLSAGSGIVDNGTKSALCHLFPIYCLDEIEDMLSNIDRDDGATTPSFIISCAKRMLDGIDTYLEEQNRLHLQNIATIFYSLTDTPVVETTNISDDRLAIYNHIARDKLLLSIEYYIYNTVSKYEPTTEQFCDIITTITRSYWSDDRQFADFGGLMAEIITAVGNRSPLLTIHRRIVEAARIVAILYYNMDGFRGGIALDPCLVGDTPEMKLRAFVKAFYYASRNSSFHHILPTILSIIRGGGLVFHTFTSIVKVDDGIGDRLWELAYYHALPFLFQNAEIDGEFTASFMVGAAPNYIDRAECAAILINTAEIMEDFRPKVRNLLPAFATGDVPLDKFISMIERVVIREYYYGDDPTGDAGEDTPLEGVLLSDPSQITAPCGDAAASADGVEAPARIEIGPIVKEAQGYAVDAEAAAAHAAQILKDISEIALPYESHSADLRATVKKLQLLATASKDAANAARDAAGLVVHEAETHHEYTTEMGNQYDAAKTSHGTAVSKYEAARGAAGLAQEYIRRIQEAINAAAVAISNQEKASLAATEALTVYYREVRSVQDLATVVKDLERLANEVGTSAAAAVADAENQARANPHTNHAAADALVQKVKVDHCLVLARARLAKEQKAEEAAERQRQAEEAERQRQAEEAERQRQAEEAERQRQAEEAERQRQAVVAAVEEAVGQVAEPARPLADIQAIAAAAAVAAQPIIDSDGVYADRTRVAVALINAWVTIQTSVRAAEDAVVAANAAGSSVEADAQLAIVKRSVQNAAQATRGIPPGSLGGAGEFRGRFIAAIDQIRARIKALQQAEAAAAAAKSVEEAAGRVATLVAGAADVGARLAAAQDEAASAREQVAVATAVAGRLAGIPALAEAANASLRRAQAAMAQIDAIVYSLSQPPPTAGGKRTADLIHGGRTTAENARAAAAPGGGAARAAAGAAAADDEEEAAAAPGGGGAAAAGAAGGEAGQRGRAGINWDVSYGPPPEEGQQSTEKRRRLGTEGGARRLRRTRRKGDRSGRARTRKQHRRDRSRTRRR